MAPTDVVVLALLAVSFAVFVTAHLAVVFGLSMRPPHWRGPVALLVAPLAPFWGLKAGLTKRSLIWIAAVAVYAVTRIVAALGA